MLKFKDEPNSSSDVLPLPVKHNIPLNDDNIRNMYFVKTAVRKEVFLQLQVELSSSKKTYHIVYHLFKTSDYLFQSPPTSTRLI